MLYPLPLEPLGMFVARHDECVLLDTARPSRDHHQSFVFVNPRRVLRCRTLHEIPALLNTLSTEARTYWITGYLAYEAAYGLEERLYDAGPTSYATDLAWFGVFDEPFIFDHRTGRWNRPHGGGATGDSRTVPRSGFFLNEHTSINERDYRRAVAAIRRLIAAGDVYQVNFTYDVSVRSSLASWELYRWLRANQPVPFGAFIKTKTAAIASFSPELLFSKQGSLLRTKPMKGTAPRGRFTNEDDAIAAGLAADDKNRSENIMIVDLLRNDLGKICRTGSVAARRLFTVERHPTVHQMTSVVEGRLRNGVDFGDVIRAIFPCGSVTGAPKLRAMEIIAGLEKGTRGVYCGAIGYWSPQGRSVFSVPIRTLQKKGKEKRWRYRVGSGIVWDSNGRAEWNECRDKCKFLRRIKRDFRIYESMLFSTGAFLYLHEHRARLFDAARYFGFPVRREAWDTCAAEIRQKLKPSIDWYKVRIFCDGTGVFSWDCEPITGDPPVAKPMVFLAKTPVDSSSPFLFHKTTYRPWYADDMEAIRNGRCFDVLHLNDAGRLTEGARSNLFLKINGRLYTPPLDCGLLPGVLRGRLIKRGKCKERMLYPRDLKRAQAVYCGNSVRGLVEVCLGEE